MSKDGTNASSKTADEEFQEYLLQLANDVPLDIEPYAPLSNEALLILDRENMAEFQEVSHDSECVAKEKRKKRTLNYSKKRGRKILLDPIDDEITKELRTAQNTITHLEAEKAREAARLQAKIATLIKQSEEQCSIISKLQKQCTKAEQFNSDAKMALKILIDHQVKINENLVRLQAEVRKNEEIIRGLESDNGMYHFRAEKLSYVLNEVMIEKSLQLFQAGERIRLLENEVALLTARQPNPPIIFRQTTSRTPWSIDASLYHSQNDPSPSPNPQYHHRS